MSNNRVVVFGPGPMFKGGIANYNTSLAKAFDKLGNIEVYIVSWTQQYPAIIPRDFIDKSSKVDQLAGTNIKVQYITNYNNPTSWNDTYKLIKDINPKMVIFQWSIAVQGLPLGYIAKKISKNTNIEVVFDLHFVKQKEGSGIDKTFTKYGIKNAHTYVVHSYQTAKELEELFPNQKLNVVLENKKIEGQKTVVKLYHPIYDMFKVDPNFDVEEQKSKLKLKKHVFLFFGFIRKYKGLHNVIPAFAEVAKQRDDVSLLIVGESFWHTLDTSKLSTKIKQGIFGVAKKVFLKKQDDEREYNPLELIDQLGLKDKVAVVNEFVPNEAVNRYFQVSDSILLYYLTATPSGVESISYNFKLPVLATKVGHFPETIKDGYNGYLAEANDIQSMAAAMIKSIEKPIDRENVAASSKDMSWENYAKAIWNSK
ncbi:MAG: glycosyltransferase [Bacteroidia bacterium]